MQQTVPDVRSAAALVGADLAGEVKEGDDGTLSFLLRDPDGNLIQVLQQAAS